LFCRYHSKARKYVSSPENPVVEARFEHSVSAVVPDDEQLRTLLEVVPQQIFVLRPDFTIEYANKAILDYHGESLTPVLFSSDVFERDRVLHHPDDVRRLREDGGHRLLRGLPVELEGRLLGADGNYRWFLMRINPLRDAHGHVVRWYGTRTDIDALKRSEERMRQDERQTRMLVDLVPHHLLMLDLSGRVLYANLTTLRYTGLTREQIVAAADVWPQIVHSADLQSVRMTLGGLAEGIGSELAIRLRRHDGEYRWILMRYTPLHDDTGRVVRWFGTGTDVDELKAGEERVEAENRVLRAEVDQASMFEEIVGSSPALHVVHTAIAQVAATDSTVLVTGETGTGKELVARAIHKRSSRAERAFVGVNCGAIPATLIASELFGHERGAFTGALQRRMGRFELAEGGTIFLDEVGDLPADVQLALLRVLQERELERVGSSRPVKVDVRVIAATNRDLKAAMANGTFRSDLYYRLNVFPIEVPPLRERVADIPLLAHYFVDRYARQSRKVIRGLDTRSIALLSAYSWPGNVRELQNVIERAVIVCQSETLTVDSRWVGRVPGARAAQLLPDELVARERQLIEAALAESSGRISGSRGAAVRLGIPSSTLESKIRSLGIDKRRFKRV
jgi:formate hydrogenlyase transcriptional activator